MLCIEGSCGGDAKRGNIGCGALWLASLAFNFTSSVNLPLQCQSSTVPPAPTLLSPPSIEFSIPLMVLLVEGFNNAPPSLVAGLLRSARVGRPNDICNASLGLSSDWANDKGSGGQWVSVLRRGMVGRFSRHR